MRQGIAMGFKEARAFGLLAALLVQGLALVVQTAAAQSVPERVEPRPRANPREAPWRGVGKLQSTAGSLRTTCTGTLIGVRMVLTAAHCLVNARTGRDYLPSSVHFIVGLEGQTYAAAATAVELIKGSFDPSHPVETRGADWALVLFDAPIGTADRILPLSERPPIPGTAVMVGGYAQENPNVITADKSCQVIGYSADAWGRLLTKHNCRATRGVSGAPLLVRTDDGWSVAGVNVARSGIHLDSLAVTTAEILSRAKGAGGFPAR